MVPFPLILFILAGRLYCEGFQTLTEQILLLLFVSHLEDISSAFCCFSFLTGIDL